MYSDTLFFIVIIGIIVFFWWVTLQQGNTIVQNWANENAFELLEARYCYFFLGPFFLRTTKSQNVYRILIRDRKSGEIRSGWARVGNWFWGVLGSNEIKVIWDKEKVKRKYKEALQ